MMNGLLRSYLSFARGEKPWSLWNLSRPIGWMTRLYEAVRRASYDHGLRQSLETGIPVISVGNLSTGGTNKTPFVELIVKGLKERGLKPGIVSRGYGGTTKRPILFHSGAAERSVVGDEPLLLSNRLPDVPIAVSSDRLADVELLTTAQVDVAVADDGFQHRRLARDCDVVLIDATCPFGNSLVQPCGILREPVEALKRADLVVITKADQASSRNLQRLKAKLLRYVKPEQLFTSRLGKLQWARWERGVLRRAHGDPKGRHLLAFSAIGNPESFHSTVIQSGVMLSGAITFKDHHRFSKGDLSVLTAEAQRLGADGFCCTEKDIYNLPSGSDFELPLWVPMVSACLDTPQAFWAALTKVLRPRFVVASNGYGEDAIGALLATQLRENFPSAQVVAFPVVGRGEPYRQLGITVAPDPSMTPSGGVVKYRIIDLWDDLKAGLLGHIKRQMVTWATLRGRIRTVVCVGDIYMFCHTLWGQGQSPVMVATAKTTLLNGHWRIEKWLYRRRARRVWARDKDTEQELIRSGVKASFAGNPIMDLAVSRPNCDWLWQTGRRIIVLPGSRQRTYQDLTLLLDSLVEIRQRCLISAILVVAKSISVKELVTAVPAWKAQQRDGRYWLVCNGLEVFLYEGEVADVAASAEVLLGMAGTANQVCAGLGVPVVSVNEKGKRVQKKLLGDAEILVEPQAVALANAVIEILENPELHKKMAQAGRSRLGTAGLTDHVVQWLSESLGWRLRYRLYETLKDTETSQGYPVEGA